MEAAFPPASAESTAETMVLDFAANRLDSIASIISYALTQHADCLWISAATLSLPNGQKVFFHGTSHSGKTTLALLLILERNWRLLSEDITLVDLKTRSFIPFGSPFAVRNYTKNLLEKRSHVVGKLTESLWLNTKDITETTKASAKVDVYVELKPLSSYPAVLTKIQSDEAVMSLCKTSNATSMPGGVPCLENLVRDAQCVRISGGSSEERLSLILALFGDV